MEVFSIIGFIVLAFYILLQIALWGTLVAGRLFGLKIFQYDS